MQTKPIKQINIQVIGHWWLRISLLQKLKGKIQQFEKYAYTLSEKVSI